MDYKMIEASKAKLVTKQANENWFDKIDKEISAKIHEACSRGLSHTQYTINFGDWQQTDTRVNVVLRELERKGYEVKRENGSDQRDGTSWNYLCISW